MADTALTISRRSPLSHAADRLAAATRASGGAVRLAELPFLAQVNVRLDAKGAAADAVGLALGLQLPLEPNTVVRAGELTAVWLGPDEWLVVGPTGGQRDLESRIRAASGDEPVAVTDVSAQRTTLLVTGPRARDLLAHGCPWICTRVSSEPGAAPRPPWPAHRSCWSPGTNPRPDSGYWSVRPLPAT